MSEADVVAVILVLGATLYAVLGGADFGAGMWTLLARGGDARRRELHERAIARIGTSIGPVWEANHVWLIFVLVVLWTAFPRAFGPIMETLYVPLALAAIGIVLRGSGFAFGKELEGRAARGWRDVFAASSFVTPFFMGTVVGAIAAGNVGPDGGDPWSSWINWLSISIGALFVASGAYVSAVFLVADSRRAGDDELAEYFSRRALATAVIAGALAVLGLFALRDQARFVYDGVTSDALPLVIASAVLGLLGLVALHRRVRRGPRPLAVGAVVTVIWAWAVAQEPYVLPQTLTVEAAAGVSAALTAVIVVFVIAVLVAGPAIGLLFTLAQRQVLED